MGRMVRKQIVMEPALERALEQRSRSMGISQSQLVSRALEKFLADDDERERRMRAWQELKRMFTEEGPNGPYGGQLPWTREELHERG